MMLQIQQTSHWAGVRDARPDWEVHDFTAPAYATSDLGGLLPVQRVPSRSLARNGSLYWNVTLTITVAPPSGSVGE